MGAAAVNEPRSLMLKDAVIFSLYKSHLHQNDRKSLRPGLDLAWLSHCAIVPWHRRPPSTNTGAPVPFEIF